MHERPGSRYLITASAHFEYRLTPVSHFLGSAFFPMFAAVASPQGRPSIKRPVTGRRVVLASPSTLRS